MSNNVQKSTSIPLYDDIPQTGLLRDKQIYPFFGIGRSTWWQWVKSGKAPEPIRLGARTTVWKAEDIRALLKSITDQTAA